MGANEILSLACLVEFVLDLNDIERTDRAADAFTAGIYGSGPV